MFAQEDVSSIPKEGLSDTICMAPITFEVERTEKFRLPNLGSKKTNGPDNIPARIIKEVVSDIAEILQFKRNTFFLRKALSKIPINCRPESLTAALCKVMKRYVN